MMAQPEAVTMARPKRASRRAGLREAGAERRCAVTGETRPVHEMLRFVVGPEDLVVFDVARDLPGRGIWLSATRDVVNTACAKGRFAVAGSGRARVSEALADEVERLLARRCLDGLGLARRAGDAVTGFEKVKAMLASSAGGVLLGAADGADDGRNRLRALAGGATVVDLFTNSELSSALGRENVVHAAIREGGLARRVVQDSARLAGFRGPDVVRQQ